ncbi:serine hydrolase domain-containing protein [Streptomyces sp. NPDC047028]|uniref:serine hydrolase domain-containing protein n=1 Tax=Streptomyces sp. NPDC047028 TaxID=3155793 RepID=UPI0033DA3BE3
MKSLRLTTVGAIVAFAALTGAVPASATTATDNAADTATAAASTTDSAAAILQSGAQQGVTDGYPGVIGLVRQGDTAAYAHAGVGDLSTRVAADPKAQFRIGSNTKAFTSTVLLQLEAEHRLSLDDSVERWLPGAVDANGYDGSKITIRELLNHTSGLPDYAQDTSFSLNYALNTQPDRAWPPQSLVDIGLAQHKPTGAPGEKWAYSNTNYVLAGMVIKAVTGNDAATEIQRRVIEPLGLHDTTFPTTDPALHGNYLHGYEYPVVSIGIRDVSTSDVQAFGPAGAIVSTLDDLATFSRALLTGRLLPPAQEAELKTTVPANADGSAAYGLGIAHLKLPCGRWAWGHNGAVLGYYSDWYSSEDGSQQVVRVNNEFHLLAGTRGQQDTAKATADAYCAL